MDNVRFGIIGCGVMGMHHLEVAQRIPALKVLALADVRPEAVQAAAKQYGIPKTYPDAAGLLADPDVDAVILSLPAGLRRGMAAAALKAGKHVLIEKPTAFNSAEIEQMLAVRGDRVAACCSSRYRSFASADAAAVFVASGEMGRLRAIHYRAFGPAGEPPAKTPPAWRLNKALNGGGILVNWGCYDLDYLLGIAGWTLRPKTVLARVWSVSPAYASWIAPGSDAETHFSAQIVCEGGIALNIERGEYMPAKSEGSWQIFGDNGTLDLSLPTAQNKQLIFHQASAEKGVVSRIIWQGDDEWETMRTGLLNDFISAVLEKRPPRTGLEQALVIQKITDAVYASAEQGRAVEIS